jgi:hypothetical protein
MAAWRRAIELSLGDADVERLRSIAQSRTEPASRVERARILLAYWEDPSFFAVGRALGLHHQTVQRCVERAVVEGPMTALDDRPRPGKPGRYVEDPTRSLSTHNLFLIIYEPWLNDPPMQLSAARQWGRIHGCLVREDPCWDRGSLGHAAA